MIIELPKRVGGTDVEYLQQQINAMKNQLENAYGGAGSGVTIEEIKAMRLEVGKEIKMGPNAVISWLQVTDNEDVASAEATQKKIDEVNELMATLRSNINNVDTKVDNLNYIPYDPYQTYIDGHMVITETVAANNLLINGGYINIDVGGASNPSALPSSINLTGNDKYATYKMTLSPYELSFNPVSRDPDLAILTKSEFTPNELILYYNDTARVYLHVTSGRGYISADEITCSSLSVGGSSVATKSDLSSYVKSSALSDYAKLNSSPTFYKTYVTSPGAISDSNSVLRWYSSNGQICTTSSSRRWKRDIEDVKDEALDPHKLYEVPVRQFRYNEGTLVDGKDDVLRIGFIAEEMDEIYPLGACYDSEDKPRDWNERALIPAMLKLIQEHNERIKVLEEKLA